MTPTDAFLIATTVLSLAYAHYAYRQSLHVPILKMALFHPDERRRIPFSTDPHRLTTIVLTKEQYREAVRSSPDGLPVFTVPIVLKNVGTKTAKGIRLRARYSALFGEVRSKGARVPNTDGTEVMVIEHQIPDIHPKQEYVHEGDYLSPRGMLFDGISESVGVRTKDGIGMNIKFRLDMEAVIEFIVYAEDSEPFFQSCKVSPESVETKDVP